MLEKEKMHSETGKKKEKTPFHRKFCCSTKSPQIEAKLGTMVERWFPTQSIGPTGHRKAGGLYVRISDTTTD